MSIKHLTIFLFIFISSVAAYAQIGREDSQTVSPRINDDRTVTFTFCVPEADDVVLKGDVLPVRFKLKTKVAALSRRKEIELEQQNDSTWSVTIPELDPDMYFYYYEVDGEEDGDSLDTLNPLVVRDIDHSYSAFIMPGGLADNYLDNPDIAHGQLIKVWYDSKVKDMSRRRMSVYLPPSYKDGTDSRYPVLYLFHGTGGDEDAWPECGRAVQILDNMIAGGKVPPTIVVMPNCNTDLDAAPGSSPYMEASPSSNNLSSMFGHFESSFTSEIVEFVDSTFRTVPDKRHRAIAGLSLGGMQTLYISVNNPGLCDYIGLFSAQTEPYFSEQRMHQIANAARMDSEIADDVIKVLPVLGGRLLGKAANLTSSAEQLQVYKDIDQKIDSLFTQPPQLFYIACGEDDFVKTMNDELRSKLTSSGYQFVYNESKGGHTWSNWRRYLLDFLPRLWK